jgi:endonuclease YncB( thermonuclease family)
MGAGEAWWCDSVALCGSRGHLCGVAKLLYFTVTSPTVTTMSIMPLTSIRTVGDGDNIEIVNQLLLPHTVEWIQISTPEEAHDAIKSMKVRT